MLKKVLFGALTVLLALSLIGCGGKKDTAAADKKDAAVTVEGTADKAVLAYAQLYAYGNPDEDAIKAAGLTEDEIKKVQEQVIGGPMFAFANFSLSKENLESVVNQYTEKIKAKTNVKVTLKKDDAENPVVELAVSTINNDASTKAAEEELNILNKALEELKAQGLTDEQLVASAEYQAFALESLNKIIDAYVFNAESNLEVPCVAVDKAEGKKYWAPKDISAIENFIWSKK
ncbi:MAG: hypothetical protein IKZ53_03240 [Selenomonadaceae bacterium]|nr:hypothetical protein [Selenomonadaceae bacterium]